MNDDEGQRVGVDDIRELEQRFRRLGSRLEAHQPPFFKEIGVLSHFEDAIVVIRYDAGLRRRENFGRL